MLGAVEGFWPVFFLMVVLKIPVEALLYLVWWGFRASEATEQAPPDSDDHRFRRFRREPKRPKGPRRGPHNPGSIRLRECPPGGRTRVFTPPAPVRAAADHAANRGVAEPDRS